MSIRIKLIFILTIVITILVGGVQVYNFIQERHHLMDVRKERFENAIHRLNVALPQIVYDLTTDQIERTIQAELLFKEVATIVLVDPKNELIMGMSKDDKGYPIKIKELPKQKPDIEQQLYYGAKNEIDLGKILLYREDKYFFETIKKNMLINGLQMVFLDFIFIFLIGNLIDRIIRRPISSMVSRLEDIAQKEGAILHSQEDATKPIDEIQILSNAIDSFERSLREKHKAEAALKEQEAFQSMLLEQIEVGVIVVDSLSQKINIANAAALNMMGLSRNEFNNPLYSDYFFNKADHDPLKTTHDDGKYEAVIHSIKGEKIPIINSVKNINFHGKKKRLKCFVDISDQRKAQEAMLRAKQAAEAATKAKSDFLANMSHEIRTPMNAILGFTDLMKYTSLDESQQQYVTMIRQSGEMLLALISDILDFSKIESGKVELESVEFNLEYLVGDLIKILKPKSQEKNLELLYSFEPKMHDWYKADPTRIRQIILNLINNAIKFTESGSVEVYVCESKDRLDDESKGKIHISVKDTGIGISSEGKSRLFQNFSQADTSITRKYGGTGLGLAISKAFAIKMNGDIDVKSELGKGSEFIVTLVLTKSTNKHSGSLKKVNYEVLKDKSIIIVDDNESARFITSTYCKQMGMNLIACVPSSSDFISRYANSQDKPDIIISDIFMKGLNGYDFVKQLRQEINYKNTKILALTSDARPGAAAEAKEAGFDGYLSKPYLRDELFSVLSVMLGEEEKIAHIVTKHSASEISLKGVRVLVVDDVSTNWQLIAVYLDMFGCIKDYATNGQEAVDKIKNNQYDICLMDMQMPVMDGISATKMIKNQLNIKIPIIALTAAVMKEDQEKALQAGMDDFLTKPIIVDVLKSTLIKWTRNKG